MVLMGTRAMMAYMISGTDGASSTPSALALVTRLMPRRSGTGVAQERQQQPAEGQDGDAAAAGEGREERAQQPPPRPPCRAPPPKQAVNSRPPPRRCGRTPARPA
jgi:hypothetical protein